jgi:glucosyl-3-phosphoglycerate synthase
MTRSSAEEAALAWFRTATSAAADWPIARVLADKQRSGLRISVVIPARNEEVTIANVVGSIRRDLMDEHGLVDELIVMDSLSADATASRARDAGARVHSVADIGPEHGVRAGKGEALWKSLFVMTGDVVIFIDADLTHWGTHFVTGLAGPLLADDRVKLVKGFYDRVLEMESGPTTQGGRVTELVARPLLTLDWPSLTAVVQPLAGEWAVRREHLASLSIPVGYGVELAVLLDTASAHGLDSIAQVDLGRRAHRHQSVHDLSVMATEILAVAEARRGSRARALTAPSPDALIELRQYVRSEESTWRSRSVPVGERPPAAGIAATLDRPPR